MTATLTTETMHRELLSRCIPGELSDADTLLWMVLLHTHGIHLRPGVGEGANGVVLDVPPLTQRHAAQVAADLWKELQPDAAERAQYTYWYRRYNTEAPYEDSDDVPDDLRPRLAELREVLARDPRVAAITVEA